ncbi:MAG: TonB C-terminal domain-containing protein [bacterium]
MNRFTLISIFLHFLLFSTIALSSKSSFKSIPKFEVYKVSVAPLPQPKILGLSETPVEPEAIKEPEKKPEEKKPPEEKRGTATKKTEEIKKVKETKKKGLPDGLPDIKPQIYTGSGRGFTYSYYLNILLSKIAQNWRNPYQGKDIILKSIVYFEVDKNGIISNIRIEDDSGDEIYNESTIRAVALTKKLPPLPEEFSNDYLKVHLEFLTAE